MTHPLRTLIVDDEPLARLRLRSLLQETADPAVQVLAEAADATSALAWLNDHPDCDLVLLDIRMPGRDGMQLAAALRSLPQPPSVVFVTAHGHHALRAFDLDAVDYLTKPVLRDRLQAALRRVRQRRWPADNQPAPLAEAPVLVVAERGRVLRIPVAEVLVLKAELKYVTLRTATASHLLDDSLTDLEKRLGRGFIRIHRNALVAAHAVRELRRVRSDAGTDGAGDGGADEGWAVRVAPLDDWLPVSRRQLAAVRAALAEGSWLTP
ncbi:MAG: LytTR family DNA-binding domain-containing protein [Rubrivivax sp.]